MSLIPADSDRRFTVVEPFVCADIEFRIHPDGPWGRDPIWREIGLRIFSKGRELAAANRLRERLVYLESGLSGLAGVAGPYGSGPGDRVGWQSACFRRSPEFDDGHSKGASGSETHRTDDSRYLADGPLESLFPVFKTGCADAYVDRVG